MDGPIVHCRHLKKKNMEGVELLALVAIIASLPALHSKNCNPKNIRPIKEFGILVARLAPALWGKC